MQLRGKLKGIEIPWFEYEKYSYPKEDVITGLIWAMILIQIEQITIYFINRNYVDVK